jgi:sulfur relay (sulfurtransferase) complex TusBCD TusD component (DsrE family)
MTEFEYEQAIKITISADLPNPQGKCGQFGGITMKLCKKCSEELGIINSEEYHNYTYSHSRFISKIKECKTKILKLCFKK